MELETDGSDPDVHVNHFVSATPRYDDTKYVETERSRAGFLRTSECPVLALDITQGYFAGSGTSGYKWTTDLDRAHLHQPAVLAHDALQDRAVEPLQRPDGGAGVSGSPSRTTAPTRRFPRSCAAIDGYGPANMMLPGDLQYVSYEDLQADKELAKPKYSYFDWSYESKKPEGSSRPAPNIDAEKPIWTYYIADMTDYLDVASIDTTVTSSTPRMNDPVLGSAFIMGDRAMKTSETVYDNTTRKFASWSFSGQLNRRPMYNEDGSPMIDPDTGEQMVSESYTRGLLQAGQALVVEIIMPVTEGATDLLTSDQLSTMGFGYKVGNFKPFTGVVPGKEDLTRGFDSDKSDVNMDGSSSQSMVKMTLRPVSFTASTNLTTSKTVTTQLDTNATVVTSAYAAVPEGSSYTYDVAAVNPDADGKKAAEYSKVVLYDVLPYPGDTEVYTSDSGKPSYRGSQWSGVLTDLDSIKVTQFSSQTALNYTEPQELREGVDGMEIWVGPYVTDGAGTLKVGEVGDLLWLFERGEHEVYGPNYGEWPEGDPDDYEVIDDTREQGINELRLGVFDADNPNLRLKTPEEAKREKNLVPLSELKSNVEALRALGQETEADALIRGLRAIWAQPKSSLYVLPKGNLKLTYTLEAPLNLPRFVGSKTYNVTVDMAEDTPDSRDALTNVFNSTGKDLTDEEQAQLNQQIEDAIARADQIRSVAQVNTYMQRVGSQDVALGNVFENVRAGAFIDAPDNRGYIGDYVYLDSNWSGTPEDDILGLDGTEMTTDEDGNLVNAANSAFQESINGRPLIRGMRYERAADQSLVTWVINPDGDKIRSDDPSVPTDPQLFTEQGFVDTLEIVTTPFDNSSKDGQTHLIDLNYDKQVDDPGINKVKVELLNEYGNPVNRDGEVVRLMQNDKTAGVPQWVRCDDVSGVPEVDPWGNYNIAGSGAPAVTYTTTDAYGNPGYYMLSNLAPGRYSLRFTFPRAVLQLLAHHRLHRRADQRRGQPVREQRPRPHGGSRRAYLR